MIEKALASKGRIKILKLLIYEKELNISEIGKRVKLPHKSVNLHLKVLKEVNLVEEEKVGRIRIFKVKENRKSKILEELFKN